jgi:transposase
MKPYLTKAKYSKISKFFEVKSKRPRLYQPFEILNAIFHILITSSQWRNLPHSYPPYITVFYHFQRWKRQKIFHEITAKLNQKSKPRILIIDNQSISDSDLPTKFSKGYDGHKHRKGRKRCILTDNRGEIQCIKYFPANMADVETAKRIITYYKLKPFGNKNSQKIQIFGDKGFHSPDLKQWLKRYNIDYQPLIRCKKPNLDTKPGWELLSVDFGYMIDMIKQIRWVVERTFAWLQKFRRLNMNYERLISSFEAMTLLAGIKLRL